MTIANETNGASPTPSPSKGVIAHIIGELSLINGRLATSNDPTERAAVTRERDRLQTVLDLLKGEPTAQVEPEQTDDDETEDANGVSDVTCATSLRGNDGTAGAHFKWRCKLTDGSTRERQVTVEVHVVPVEDLRENLREGLFAYWKQIDMGNGYYAVSSLRFDGEIENTEHPNAYDRQLMRPFKTALHDFLEKREDVGYLEMATFVDGGARFVFQVAGAPDGDTPDLRLTLERGDN